MRKEQKANYPESARGAAALLVRMVLEDGAYTNIALNQYLRGSRLSDLDRRLATELVYGTVKASGRRQVRSSCPMPKSRMPIICR